MFNISILGSLEDLASIRDEWCALASKCQNVTPYQTWEWNYHWIERSGQENSLYVVAVRNQEGSLVSIAPLQKKRRWGATWSVSFISQDASIYPDCLIRQGKDIPLVLSAILSHLFSGPIGMIDLVFSDPSPTIDFFRMKAGQEPKQLLAFRQYSKRLVVTIGPDYEKYLAGLGRKMRQEIRAETRKLQQQFDVGFLATGKGSDFDEKMRILFYLNSLKWGGDPDKTHPQRRACYLALSQSDKAIIFILTCNGKPVGALGALVMGNTLFAEVAGFDYSIAKIDLGKVFYHYVFQFCVIEGLNRFDFSSGEEPYKFRYRPEELGKYKLTLYKHHCYCILFNLIVKLNSAFTFTKKKMTKNVLIQLIRNKFLTCYLL